MATTPPPDFNQPPPMEPEPAPPSPWETLEQRGFDPSRYNPDQIVQGANFMAALSDRNYAEGAIGDLLQKQGYLPEGMTPRELKELVAQHQAAQQDPWAQYEPDQYEDPYQQQAPAFDPRQLQSAIDMEIERRFQERDRIQAERQQQEAFEHEFTYHADRVAKKHDLDQQEVVWLAAEANMLRGSMPYATTEQIMDAAGDRLNDRITKRLQAMAQQQQQAPAAPLPSGAMPSDQQVPQNAEEARRAAQGFFTN